MCKGQHKVRARVESMEARRGSQGCGPHAQLRRAAWQILDFPCVTLGTMYNFKQEACDQICVPES